MLLQRFSKKCNSGGPCERLFYKIATPEENNTRHVSRYMYVFVEG